MNAESAMIHCLCVLSAICFLLTCNRTDSSRRTQKVFFAKMRSDCGKLSQRGVLSLLVEFLKRLLGFRKELKAEPAE